MRTGADAKLTVTNGQYLVQGIQLRTRALVPEWLGNSILWLFFHRLDTSTQITISGLAGSKAGPA